MRKLISLVSLVSSLFSWEFDNDSLSKLNSKQLSMLQQSYSIGKEYDLGYTLAAIAVVETRLGNYMREENYCGIHQVSINTTKSRFDTLQRYKDQELCKYINDSVELSSKLAIRELLYWKKVRKDNWRKVVMSYNGGWNTTKHGVTYLSRITKVIKVLKSNRSWNVHSNN